MTLSILAAALNVLILLQTTAYSLSTSSKQERTQENEIALTKADSGLSSDFNTPLDISQLQTELASLSIHSYFKELYINLTSHVESSSSTKASAIYSYKNQVKCKDKNISYNVIVRHCLLLLIIAHHCLLLFS